MRRRSRWERRRRRGGRRAGLTARWLGGPTPCFEDFAGGPNHPLLPGLPPDGLRALVLSLDYNRPLQPDSLPLTLTFLQLSSFFDQPTAPIVLPASLLYLSVRTITHCHHQQLLQSLPASLERLSLDRWPYPLQVGVWPHRGRYDHPLPPGVLPLSLRSLAIGY